MDEMEDGQLWGKQKKYWFFHATETAAGKSRGFVLGAKDPVEAMDLAIKHLKQVQPKAYINTMTRV